MIGGLELRGGDHAELAVQAAVVEPVDVLQGGVFDVVQAAPGAAVPDQLGLVQPVEGLGERVVIAVAARADRGDRTGLGEALGVADREVLDAADALLFVKPARGAHAYPPASRLKARSP